MATYEEAIDALRNAQAAGDTEAARRLADIAFQLAPRQAAPRSAAEPELSLTGALQYGVEAATENLAQSARAVGWDEWSAALSEFTDPPEDYTPQSPEFIRRL